MGLRGPSPTPTPILAARGSRLAAQRAGEPSYPVAAPECPAWLPKAAKKEWRRIVPLLLSQGLVALVDMAALSAYCLAVSELQQATETLEAEGRRILVGGREVPADEENRTRVIGGQWQPHPAVGQQRSAWAAVKQYSALFGLSPSDRARVKAAPPEAKPSGKSRFFGGA